MKNGIFGCPAGWRPYLPADTDSVKLQRKLADEEWGVLALTHKGCQRLKKSGIRCCILVVPGEAAEETARHVRADTVITCGLSLRDSLTLSSLERPLLCIQRQLLRPDGVLVEPQEIRLPTNIGSPEQMLPLFALNLLLMPLTDPPGLDMLHKKEDLP